MEMSGMPPLVVGAADGFQVEIEVQREGQDVWYNRHHKTGISNLLLSGSNNEISFISSNSPGSLHDSDVFHSSDLFVKLHVEKWRAFPGAIIIGDSAYVGTYPFMATPYLDGATRGDERKQRYNVAFKKARNVVERTIGILKNKFIMLKKGLRMKDMVKCARVIEILCAIHNFIVRKRNPDDEDSDTDDDDGNAFEEQQPLEPMEGVQTRDRLLEIYF